MSDENGRRRAQGYAWVGVYAKCPECECRENCARDGKRIVDLDRLRSEAGTPDEGGAR